MRKHSFIFNFQHFEFLHIENKIGQYILTPKFHVGTYIIVTGVLQCFLEVIKYLKYLKLNLKSEKQ